MGTAGNTVSETVPGADAAAPIYSATSDSGKRPCCVSRSERMPRVLSYEPVPFQLQRRFQQMRAPVWHPLAQRADRALDQSRIPATVGMNPVTGMFRPGTSLRAMRRRPRRHLRGVNHVEEGEMLHIRRSRSPTSRCATWNMTPRRPPAR
jgi:hypothetical protein